VETIPDERLALVFTCCHPALAVDAQVALTLREVCGLTTGEIARAFLTAEPAMAQRLVRAKRRVRATGIPFRVPPDHLLPDRLRSVLRVIYLVFNEGYASRDADALVRHDLCAEALRLAKLLCVLMPDEPEALGLLALILLHDSRRDARLGPDGELRLLDDQDRSLWDATQIAEGVTLLERALRMRRSGSYQLQAVIAAGHAQGSSWPTIVAAYDELVLIESSPVVRLNRAVAVALSGELHRGLSLLEELDELAGYPYFHAAKADLLRRAERADDARAEYRRALELTKNEPERRFLLARLASSAPTDRESARPILDRDNP
jgi:RNA polymerase sigma-70 factor (ECF subfamily)